MSADILLSTYLRSELKKKRMLCYSITNVSCQVLVFVPLETLESDHFGRHGRQMPAKMMKSVSLNDNVKMSCPTREGG